jgi:hypothetical protein
MGLVPYHVGEATGGTGKRGSGPPEGDAPDPVTAGRAHRPRSPCEPLLFFFYKYLLLVVLSPRFPSW